MWGKRRACDGHTSRVAAPEVGQAIVVVGIMLTALLGMLALAVDGGNLYLLRRHMQAGVDLAALSGAQYLYDGSVSQAIDASKDYATRNGYPDAIVNVPPTSGRNKGDHQYVEVMVQRETPTFFAGILGIDRVAVSARAVARAGRDSSPYAILALSRTASPAIGFGGSNSAKILSRDDHGGMMSNSGMDASIKQQATSGAVYVEGPVNATGTILGNFDATAVNSGVPPYPDPLTGMPPPTFGYAGSDAPTTRHGSKTMPKTLVVPASGGDLPPSVSDCQSVDAKTFCPGVYWGGISMQGGKYKMMPGIYVMAGGGFQLTAGAGLSGSGILIYNTNDPKPSGGNYGGATGDFGPINLSTNGTSELYASHDPQYYRDGYGWGANVLIYQDPKATDSGDAMTVQAGGNMRLFGTIYIPTNGISISGGGAAGVGNGQIIASWVYFTGSSATTVVYDPEWAVVPPGSTLAE